MEGSMVYPTAPFDAQAQHPSVGVPPASAGANVESPGKTMEMFSKVKKKAKMLRNKMKHATGSNTASTDHGDNAPEHGNREFNGMPGAHEKDVDDDDEAESHEDEEDEQDFPKSNEHKYEQLRSIGALDNHGDGSEVEVRGGIPVPAMADNTPTSWKGTDAGDPISAFKSAGPPGALQATPTAYRNYAADEEEFSGEGVSSDSGNRGFEVPLEKGGRSDESVPTVSGPECKREIGDSSRPYNVSEKPDPKQGESNVSVFGKDEPVLGNLASSSQPLEEAAAPNDQVGVVDEDLFADRKLGVGLSSDQLVGSEKVSGLETPSAEFGSGVNKFDTPSAKSGESQSKHGVLGIGGISASGTDEPYPGDLVQPNPSFGQSLSPMHDKIGVMNSDVLPDEKLGLGLSSGDKSGSGNGNVIETSVPEGEELSGYQQHDSLDELVYKPVSDLAGQSEKLSENSLPTSGPSMAATKTDSDNVAHSDSHERVYDVVPPEQFTHEEVVATGDDSHEGGGQWPADKIFSAREATVGSLVASDPGNNSETPDNSGNKFVDATGSTDNTPETTKLPTGETLDSSENKFVDAVGTTDKMPETTKPAVVEEENQEPEEEFYNPNEVKNDQFKKGFALGNAEDDALSGTLAGSAIETLQGLKNTVQSSLGYSNQPDSDAGGEDRSDIIGSEEKAFSPRGSQQQQSGGFVHGLRQSFKSSLGYGRIDSEENVGEEADISERGVESEGDFDGRHQQSDGAEQVDEKTFSPRNSQPSSPGSSQQRQKGGFVQGLRQSIASSLGYGKADLDEQGGPNTDALETGEELETGIDTGHKQADDGHVLSSDKLDEQEEGGSVNNLKQLSDKEGYHDGRWDKQSPEFDVDTKQQQPAGTYQTLKNVFASTLGYGVESGEESVTSEEPKSSEYPVNSEQRELSSKEGENPVSVSSPGIVVNDAKDNAGRMDEATEPSPRKRGMLQGLKDTLTSSLGYNNYAEESHKGISEPAPKVDPEPEREPESVAQTEFKPEPEFEPESKAQTEFKIEPELVSYPGTVVNDSKDNVGRIDETAEPSPRRRGMFQGLKDTLTSSLGYNNHPEETHKGISESEPKVDPELEPEPERQLESKPELEPESESESEPEPETETEPVSSPGVAQSPSYTQKFMDTTAAARNYLSSKVGYGSSNEDREGTNMGNEH